MNSQPLKLSFMLIVLFFSLNLQAMDPNYSKLLKMSERIDAIVLDNLKNKKITANAKVSDAVFLRRAYLDLTGRIPTFEEAQGFLTYTGKNKRQLLINKLIVSEGYNSHTYNQWADTLRATTRLQKIPGANYQKFIKDSIKKDTPFDKFVHEMLTSEGKAYKHGNGATGYYLRDMGMPLDNMANTMQVFLGTDMVCAQCHDHPFDDWTQVDFYQLAAFTSGTKGSRYYNDKKDPIFQKLQKESKTDIKLKKSMRNLAQVKGAGLYGGGTGFIRLPHDYDYEDHKPFGLIAAKVPFGKFTALKYPSTPASIETLEAQMKKRKKKMSAEQLKKRMARDVGKDIGARNEFADWVTSRNNTMFTRTLVNRLWSRAMGAPLASSLISIPMSDKGSIPALMREMEAQMKTLNYDTRAFMYVLYSTQAYQRQLHTETFSPGMPFDFPGSVQKRLTAEQLWDSIVTLGSGNIDDRSGPDMAAKNSNMFAQIDKLSSQQIYDFLHTNKGKKNKALEELGMSSMNMMAQKNKGTRDKLNSEAKDLQRKIKKSSAKKQWEVVKKLRIELTKLNAQRGGNFKKQLLRASEMPSPAPAGHFLRRFGQSEREVIDSASDEASVPQALALMNGEIEYQLISNKDSKINEVISQQQDDVSRIKVAFLSILSRLPTLTEKAIFLHRYKEDPKNAQRDLIWVLINSNEFRFRQ